MEWRNLGDIEAYIEKFLDMQFYLEIVLQEKVCLLSVASGKSFVGLFQDEGMGDYFEFLQGAMLLTISGNKSLLQVLRRLMTVNHRFILSVGMAIFLCSRLRRRHTTS